MSADNGIYILATKGGKRGRKEYRVVHAQVIEQIEQYPPDPTGRNIKLDAERTLLLFGNCQVFTDRKIAQGYALRVHEEHDNATEYGIVFLDYMHIRFPYAKNSYRIFLRPERKSL